MTNMTYNECFENIKTRISTLADLVWEGYPRWTDVENWLANFKGLTGITPEQEQLHALFILSEFLYFGSRQIRTLLHALYRDHFLIPLIQRIRTNNGNTRNLETLRSNLRKELGLTRFLGIGNPSESGVHLLYYFRQENRLPLSFFWDISNVLKIKEDPDGNYITDLVNPKILRYVFIDDISGTGETVINYSNNLLSKIQKINNKIEFHYLTLFGTSEGLRKIRQETVFKNNCAAIFELDLTYRVLSDYSRYIVNCPSLIDQNIINKIVRHYGLLLWKKNPCGYGDNQIILGMHHNIPNNTIPIIWWEDTIHSWVPIFKRHEKIEELEI